MPKAPLGGRPYKIAISRDELDLLVQHRQRSGEPLQSFVRRLIREHGEQSRDQGNPLAATEAAASAKLLSPEMQKALEEAARVEKRRPDELLKDAVQHYLNERHGQVVTEEHDPPATHADRLNRADRAPGPVRSLR